MFVQFYEQDLLSLYCQCDDISENLVDGPSTEPNIRFITEVCDSVTIQLKVDKLLVNKKIISLKSSILLALT